MFLIGMRSFLYEGIQTVMVFREICGMAARCVGDGERKSSLTLAEGSIGKLMGFDIFNKGFHAL